MVLAGYCGLTGTLLALAGITWRSQEIVGLAGVQRVVVIACTRFSQIAVVLETVRFSSSLSVRKHVDVL